MPGATNPLLQRVNALDRSTEPIVQQITEAFGILGIDPKGVPPIHSREVTERYAHEGFGPKEEWVLRWLLKRLDADSTRQSNFDFATSPSLVPEAWLLLRVVLARLPATVVARFLKTYKFTIVLETTLQRLCEYLGHTALALSSNSESARSRESSSSATIGNGSTIEVKNSKKRKRDETEIESSKAVVDRRIDSAKLFICICSALQQMEDRATDVSHGESLLPAEYIKAALKTPPEAAARILGSCMIILERFVSASVPSDLEQSAAISYDTMLVPILRLWSFRSSPADDIDGLLSARIFSTECLVPALKLSQELRLLNSPTNDNVRQILDGVEKLIASYIIFPGRSAFMTEKRSHDSAQKAALPFIEELLKPVTKNFTLEFNASSAEESLKALPFLFEVAVRISRLETPKQRTTETPWLQYLLTILVKHCSAMVSDHPPGLLNSTASDVLKQLLRLAIASKLSLVRSVLEDLIVRCSRLYGEASARDVDWSLIRLGMEMMPTYFTMPNASKEFKARGPSEQDSAILTKALSKLQMIDVELEDTSSDLKSSTQSLVLYNLILHEFIHPLLEAHIGTRNLTVFVKLWFGQLVAWHHHKATSTQANTVLATTESVWEDEGLLRAVSERLETSLAVSQISSLLRTAFDSIKSISDVMSMNLAEVFANFTIIDCLVDGIKAQDNVSKLEESMRGLYRVISAALLVHVDVFKLCRWRLWRILTTITHRCSIFGNPRDEIFGSRLELISKARYNVEDALNNGRTGLEYLALSSSAFFAFGYMLGHDYSAYGEEENIVNAKEALSCTIKTLVSVARQADGTARESSGQPVQTLNWSWNPSRHTLQDNITLAFSCTFQLVARLQCFLFLDQSLLRDFLQSTYSYACTTNQPDTKLGDLTGGNASSQKSINWQDLFKQLLRSPAMEEHGLIETESRKLQLSELVSAEKAASLDINRSFLYDFALENIQYIHFSDLRKDERVQVANVVSERLLIDTGRSNNLYHSLNVLIRLMKVPRKSMVMVTDPEFIWKLANLLDNSKREEEVGSIFALRRLTGLILDYTVTTAPERESHTYLQTYYTIILKNCEASLEMQEYGARSMLVEMSLNFLRKHYDVLVDIVPDLKKSLGSARSAHYLTVVRLLVKLEQEGISSLDSQLTMLLSSLSCYQDLMAVSIPETSTEKPLDGLEEIGGARVWPLLRSIEKKLKGISTSLPLQVDADIEDISLAQDMLVGIKRLISLEPDSQREDSVAYLTHGLLGLKDFTSTKARQCWLKFLQSTVHKLDAEQQVQIMQSLVDWKRTNIDEHDALSLLRRLLARSHNAEVSEMKLGLSQIFSTVVGQLGQDSVFKTYVLKMSCLDLMLRKNSWVISQWHIDSLLAAISKATSVSGPHIQGLQRGDVFIGLCRLFNSMLAFHRMKLGGRYHLVILALQGLLRCLFHPYKKASKGDKGISRPRWLSDPKVVLDESHAAAYARILTTICDPSVSAVTRSKNRLRHELNDETKKAKSIAGQHLQYLIMEFCRCQLRGRLAPAVRAALNPGIYAVFDAMSQDIMRTINAALDSSGRSIFKILYDDYRRFGRWDGS